MRPPRNSFTVLAGLTLLALPAAAQTTQPGYDDQERTTQERAQRARDQIRDRDRQGDLALAPNLRKVSDLLDLDLVDRSNKEIGKVEDFVVNIRTGELRYAAVSLGGFLGIGATSYAVPLHTLSYDVHGDRMRIDMTRDEVERHHKLDRVWPARFERDRHIGNVEQERDVMRLSQLKKVEVRDARGQEIGRIEDVVFDVQRGEIAYVVLNYRQFEGREAASFAIPLVSLQPATRGDGVMIQVQQQDFRREDRLVEGRWPMRATSLTQLVRHEQQTWRQDDRGQQDQQTWRQDDRWQQDRQQDDWRRQQDQQTWRQQDQRWQQDPQQDDWRRQQDQQTWRQDGRMETRPVTDMGLQTAFTAAEDKTLRARIESVREEQGKCLVTVKTPKDETFTVLLAPMDYLRQEGIEIREGQELSLTGKMVFVPMRIQHEQRTVQLRDQRGQARWDDRRMDFGRTQAREAGFETRREEDALSRHLRSARSETFRGQVVNLTRRSIERENYLVVVLRDQRGNTREVVLLDAEQLSSRDLGVSPGSQASVEAARADVDGRQIWIAKSIEIDGRRMQLRGDMQRSDLQREFRDQRHDLRDQQRDQRDRFRDDDGR